MRRFETKFLELWRIGSAGDAFVPGLLEDEGGRRALEAYRVAFMARLLAGLDRLRRRPKMPRRILGLAHVEDMESIGDSGCRALCERRALKLVRELMLGRSSITSIGAVRQLAETLPRR